MQTSKDAVDALLRGRMAEYVPLEDNPWGDTLRKWVTQGMPTNGDGGAVDAADHFGFDMAGVGGWFRWEALEPRTVEETDEWKIVRNGNGALLKWWKSKSGTPEHVDFDMSCRAVWDEKYRPHLLGDHGKRVGDVQATRENLARRRDQGKWAFYGNQFVWECLRASLGDVNMLMALIEDPEWIHDFNRVHTDMWKECYRILFEEAGLPDGIWVYEDLGYRERLFCSPELLRDLIFPYYKELVAFFHGYDLPVVFHSCGYQEPMIPLAIDAGFDALNPMEAKAGNDLLAYADRYGDELCFVGGLDARVLESGERDAVEREVKALVGGMRERGARFVYGSDHSLSTNIDYEDFVYSLEVYREVCTN